MSTPLLFEDLPEEESPLSPPLKWAGGKRWLVPAIKRILDGRSTFRLVEPFVGGMAVALGLTPKVALLNDLNPHLINFYNQIKAGLKIETSFLNESDYFYKARDRFNVLCSDNAHTKEQAELFYYLNRTGFNGLCRFNNKGEFNVPFGKYGKINYALDFNRYKTIFSAWDFTCNDFEDLRLEKGDVLYVDPPYDVEFTKYSKEDFTWKDQVRLVEWMEKKKFPMIISNQATDRILELYSSKGFTVSTILGPRRISCNGDRKPCPEMVATKNIL